MKRNELFSFNQGWKRALELMIVKFGQKLESDLGCGSLQLRSQQTGNWAELWIHFLVFFSLLKAHFAWRNITSSFLRHLPSAGALQFPPKWCPTCWATSGSANAFALPVCPFLDKKLVWGQKSIKKTKWHDNVTCCPSVRVINQNQPNHSSY